VDAAKKYRTRPDGSELTLINPRRERRDEERKVVELVVNYWDKVGIKERGEGRGSHLLQHAGVRQTSTRWPSGASTFSTWRTVPTSSFRCACSRKWYGFYGMWRQSLGKQGVKPEGDVALLLEYWTTSWLPRPRPTSPSGRTRSWRSTPRNVWAIGTVGISPQLVLATNRLRNFPEGLYYCDEMRQYSVANPSQFFMKQ